MYNNLFPDNHQREKKLLVEEVVQLKKQNETIQREIHDRERQIAMATGELEKGSSSLTSAEHQIHMLEAEVCIQHRVHSDGRKYKIPLLH